MKMTSTLAGEGGVYLGASAQYPGSISSVDVELSGTGNVVVATSNGEVDWLLACPYAYKLPPSYSLADTAVQASAYSR